MSLLAVVFLLAALEAAEAAPPAVPPPAPKAEILGLWKGSSTCTKVEAAEFCHDETVVYNFVDVPSQPATVSLKAAKIMHDTLQPTYMLYFTYRPDERRWASQFDHGRTRGVWAYAVNGDELSGNLALLPDQTVVRNVAAKRVARDQVLPR